MRQPKPFHITQVPSKHFMLWAKASPSATNKYISSVKACEDQHDNIDIEKKIKEVVVQLKFENQEVSCHSWV